MKKIIFTFFILLFFSLTVQAEEAHFKLFGVDFTDTQESVENKIEEHFDLSSFKKYYQYPIGEGKYRILFEYNGPEGRLSQIKIYGKHFSMKEFRTRGKSNWKDLDRLATELFGEGFGDLPFLTHIQKGVKNSDKDWVYDNVRADLGIQMDEYGYFASLTIRDIPKKSFN